MAHQEKKYTKAQLQQVFKMLLAKDCNKRCADCPAKVPRWYSCNLGVFLCINCAGFHRGLGTHITFVQSFNLDTPKLKDLKTLKKWGNARGNAYWQARAKPSDLPTPADCDINSKKLKQFITDKYERRRWAVPGIEPEAWLKKNGGKEPQTKSVKTRKTTKTKQRRKVKSKPVAKPTKSPAPAMTFGTADADPFGIGSLAPAPTPAPAPAPAPAATSATDDLLGAFGDFSVSSTSTPAAAAPAPVASALDIDSLYASAAPAPAPSAGMSGMSAFGGLGSGWDMNAMAPAAARPQPAHQQHRGVPMAAHYQRQQYAQPQYGYQQQQQYAYQQQQQRQQQQRQQHQQQQLQQHRHREQQHHQHRHHHREQHHQHRHHHREQQHHQHRHHNRKSRNENGC